MFSTILGKKLYQTQRWILQKRVIFTQAHLIRSYYQGFRSSKIKKCKKKVISYLCISKLHSFIIDCHKTSKSNRKVMDPSLQQGFLNYPYFPQPYFPHIMNSMFYPPWNHHFYPTSMNFNQEHDPIHQNVKKESEPASYEAKVTPNVVLRKKQKPDTPRPSHPKLEVRSSTKNQIRIIKLQKENRNVVSNLLRVFLKNILEVHSYDDYIDSIIQKHNLEITGEEFCFWLVNFKINFKNYIKPKEIMRIVNAKHSEQQQLIFRILLRQFIDTLGVSHCLTSKRLDRVCSRRHIEGLRDLLTLHQDQNL